MPEQLDTERVRVLGLSAALNIDISAEKAVEIVKAMFAGAALSDGETTVKVTINVRDDLSIRMDVPKACVVTGEVCVPYLGCHCVCIVPPASSC